LKYNNGEQLSQELQINKLLSHNAEVDFVRALSSAAGPLELPEERSVVCVMKSIRHNERCVPPNTTVRL